MANLQRLAQQVEEGKALLTPVIKEKQKPDDPDEVDHVIVSTTKYDPDSGTPFTTSEKLPDEAELLRVIALTEADLAGLNATLALVRSIIK